MPHQTEVTSPNLPFPLPSHWVKTQNLLIKGRATKHEYSTSAHIPKSDTYLYWIPLRYSYMCVPAFFFLSANMFGIHPWYGPNTVVSCNPTPIVRDRIAQTCEDFIYIFFLLVSMLNTNLVLFNLLFRILVFQEPCNSIGTSWCFQ